MSLTVGDLFCGAGGFSEGFRQAGFQIKWGVDHWSPAVRTFDKNFPESEALPKNALDLDTGDLEPVDVVIGSPPCTYFSLANRGGGGDRERGYEFVARFLEIVKELEPKYWVMENVPHLRGSLEEHLDGDRLLLNGVRIEIPRRKVLRADHYGTPQRRRRLFSGKFPTPRGPTEQEQGQSLSLESVLKRLPDPCEGLEGAKRWALDPVYGKLRLSARRLRDHFEDKRWRLRRDELRQCREWKQNNGVYGRMDFPDRLDRPSRTITAVRTHTSRATIVVNCPHHPGRRYRTLTLRECASLQGFPLTFNFWTGSVSHKDRLVGNAVPPPMARAIAVAILKEEGLPFPARPIVNRIGDVPDSLQLPERRPPRYSKQRRFRAHVLEDWEPSCRVELDNRVELDADEEKSGLHVLPRGKRQSEWVTHLYLGYAKDYRCYEIRDEDALLLIESVEAAPGDEIPSLGNDLRAILREAEETFRGSLPNAPRLQAGWAGRADVEVSPFDVLSRVEGIIDNRLPVKSWGHIQVPAETCSAALRPRLARHGVHADAEPPRAINARTLGAVIALSVACGHINHDGGRIENRGESRYVSDKTAAAAADGKEPIRRTDRRAHRRSTTR